MDQKVSSSSMICVSAGGASLWYQINTSCEYYLRTNFYDQTGSLQLVIILTNRQPAPPLRFLCCSSEAELWDWVTSFLRAQVSPPSANWSWIRAAQSRVLYCFQNDDPGPPVLRRHSSSDISKQKFGTMPLVPIRGNERNSSMLSANQTLVRNSRSWSDTRTSDCLLSWNLPLGFRCFTEFLLLFLQRKLHDRRTLSMYFVSSWSLYWFKLLLPGGSVVRQQGLGVLERPDSKPGLSHWVPEPDPNPRMLTGAEGWWVMEIMQNLFVQKSSSEKIRGIGSDWSITVVCDITSMSLCFTVEMFLFQLNKTLWGLTKVRK